MPDHRAREQHMSPPEISAERFERVESARAAWIKRLIDLSRRNNLLYFRELQVGTLDLSGADPEGLGDLLRLVSVQDQGGISLRRLVGPLRVTQAAASLQRIAEKALSNFEERGLDTLFLALGLASWRSDDGGRPSSAPIVLVPVKASRAGLSGDWTLRRVGDIQVNHVLLHALEVEHGLQIPPEPLLLEIQGDDDGEQFDLQPAFAHLSHLAADIDGFVIDPKFVLGNFSFQKLAIVRDLKDLGEPLARHPIVAGISGDAEAREVSRGDRTDPDPREFDSVPPADEFLVRDSDSTQQKAVANTLRGRNGVVSGPPGTGKSQTIANLIAEMAARGKTVLFVAEKRAALDVVLERLREVELGHLCLDLHGADISRKLVARQVAESLDIIRQAAKPEVDALHARFVERRNRLNGHVQRMHAPQPPTGLSVYQIYGQLSRLPAAVASRVRFSAVELSKLNSPTIASASHALEELSSLATLFTEQDASPWNGAAFRDGAAVRSAIDCSRRLAHDRWPRCRDALVRLRAEWGIRQQDSTGTLRADLDTLRDLDVFLARWHVGILREDLDALRRDLGRARTTLGAWFAAMTDSRFRRARALVNRFARHGRVSGPVCLQAVGQAKAMLSKWQSISTAEQPPDRLEQVNGAIETFTELMNDLRQLLAAFPDRDADIVPLAGLGDWLDGLAGDTATPSKLVRVHQLQEELAGFGLMRLLKDLREGRGAPSHWVMHLRHAWLMSALEDAQVRDPQLSSFSGRTHDEIKDEFCRLDRERLKAAVSRVRRAHAERATETRNRFGNQSALVTREAAKKTRHLPLRQMVAEASDVLLSLRPCWMASPLSVSQLIPGDRPYFDLVIFDEASQVLPEDAVTSLLRGKQAVVAGDSRQLPPTTFFAAADPDNEDDDEDSVSGFESILDVMTAFLEPPWSLDWHYRSRDEALIAFSNHHVYGDRLVTFPGPGRVPAIVHHLVTSIGHGGQDDSGADEVNKVVSLVMDHATTRPDESLGVIAMGIKHADRISMALERARRERPESEDFFSATKRERFFVKNLERVQGDERDAIILTIGYGKDPTGRLLYRFGPLLQEGGERRLNVAVTRARNRMSVVSSFTHHDMDPSRSRAKGVELLRHYLEYAASGGRSLGHLQGDAVPLNEFEQGIFDALTAAGLHLLPQHGTSQYRIDLVAQHPTRPGRHVLAIECDGATYHSSPTARDRDRLRQQHLEALGWRFHRIWSTDWFLRRTEEIQRTVEAFQDAVRHADRLDEQPRDYQSIKAEADVDMAVPVATGSGAPMERPRVFPGQPIEQYSGRELIDIVRWVNSDGKLRTDDEIVAEVARELGFARRGSRIVEAIKSAIGRSRPRPSTSD